MAKGISQTPIQADGLRKKGKKEMKTKSKKQAAPAKKNATTPKKPASSRKCAKDDQCDEIASLLTELIEDFLEAYCNQIPARIITVRRVVSKAAPSVPTADRIKIAPSVKKQCKEALKKGDKSKPKAKSSAKKEAPAPLFTADEQKKILDLRKKGLSIKNVAKAIKRGDHAVAAFLKPSK